MESNAIERARLVTLTEEIDAIHFANSLFWRHKEAQTRDAIAEYQSRQERWTQISRDVFRLGASIWRQLTRFNFDLSNTSYKGGNCVWHGSAILTNANSVAFWTCAKVTILGAASRLEWDFAARTF
jgi:hypothetical protein